MKILKPVFKGIKKPFKRLKVYLKQRAGWLGIPKILPYRGFGDSSTIYISGMVMEDKGLTKPADREKIWENILAMIKRFSSDEIPGVRVKADFAGLSQTGETDEMGYFYFRFNINDSPEKLSTQNWHPFTVTLLDEIVDNQPEVTANGIVRVITGKVNRIIVSDIDDTVLVSHSTQLFRKLRLMLFHNALTRTPFEGVSSFYKALEKGKDTTDNPFFYVSSSEWNLYDLLENFFDHNDIPKGVLQLRKLENSIYKFWKSGQGSHEHKYEKIKFLLEFYKSQQFILIGDSGQKDPEIYLRLANDFPGRIGSIYIRKIGSGAFIQNIEQVNSKLEKVKTTYLQVESTRDAVLHAYNSGYIAEDMIIESSETDEPLKI
jgi:phosphatidate phosphatase APP1